MNTMHSFPGVVPGETSDGVDRAAAWNRSRAQQDMAGAHHLPNQPYYGAAYNGFEQNMLSAQSPRQLAQGQGYYSGRAPPDAAAAAGGSSYYHAQSYGQAQPAQPVSRTGPGEYPYPGQQLGATSSAGYYPPPQTYPAQGYAPTDEYYAHNPSSGSTFPSVSAAGGGGGGTYQSISPPLLPIAESHHPRPLIPASDRLVRTESGEQSTPEIKPGAKKELPQQGTPGSGRKGKGKAPAADEDDAEDEDAQEAGKEGKVSTADFIRRLWTMVSTLYVSL